jgi:hypothetical protein
MSLYIHVTFTWHTCTRAHVDEYRKKRLQMVLFTGSYPNKKHIIYYYVYQSSDLNITVLLMICFSPVFLTAGREGAMTPRNKHAQEMRCEKFKRINPDYFVKVHVSIKYSW